MRYVSSEDQTYAIDLDLLNRTLLIICNLYLLILLFRRFNKFDSWDRLSLYEIELFRNYIFLMNSYLIIGIKQKPRRYVYAFFWKKNSKRPKVFQVVFIHICSINCCFLHSRLIEITGISFKEIMYMLNKQFLLVDTHRVISLRDCDLLPFLC